MKKIKNKNFTSWKEIRKKLNLSNEAEARIQEQIRLYDLTHSLRNEKEKKSLNNEMLAKLSNIPRPEVSKILNGKVNVSLLRLSALARALGKELVITLK